MDETEYEAIGLIQATTRRAKCKCGGRATWIGYVRDTTGDYLTEKADREMTHIYRQAAKCGWQSKTVVRPVCQKCGTGIGEWIPDVIFQLATWEVPEDQFYAAGLLDPY